MRFFLKKIEILIRRFSDYRPKVFVAVPKSLSRPAFHHMSLSASFSIKETMRLRSSFELIDSSSLTAEGLIRISYLGTLLQVLEDIFKTHIRLVCPILKR